MRSGPSRLTAPSVLVREPVGRADEREVAQARLLELVADAGERPARVERLREHVEQRGALLERVDQAAVGADLLGAQLVEQPGGAADEEPPVLVGRVLERAADREQERALARRLRLGSSNATLDRARADARAGERARSGSRRPRSTSPGSTGSGNAKRCFDDAAGRRDHDDHHDVRLEQEHLDVADRRRLERRRRDEREQPRHLREHLGRRLERLLDLGARGGAARAGTRPGAPPAARAARRRRAGSRPRSARGRPRCADA